LLDSDQLGILGQLRLAGVAALPFLMIEDTRQAIGQFARVQPSLPPLEEPAGRLLEARGGSMPVIMDVAAPHDCPQVRTLMEDPWLLDVVRAHLGYRPRRVLARLFWSFVTDASDAERRAQGQTIDFHYDIDGCNAVYLFFYIEGGTRESGAHVSVLGSHAAKPLRMVASRAFQPEARVLRRYGAGSVRALDGGPGSGFFEDPACFHKVLPPRAADRLCLQLRYI
jgi:hypothetical protein